MIEQEILFLLTKSLRIVNTYCNDGNEDDIEFEVSKTTVEIIFDRHPELKELVEASANPNISETFF